MGPFGKIVYFLGDVHGNMNRLNAFIETWVRRHPQVRTLAEQYEKDGEPFDVLILQCGDMAYYWPDLNNLGRINNEVDFLPSGRVPIYWTGGNHEDWDRLDRLFPVGSAAARSNIAQVDDGVYFCRFGATLELTPDITVLFAGGAESIDKDYRLQLMREGAPKIWWDQEGISKEDLDRLANVPSAQIIVSHTAPSVFNLKPFLAGNSWERIGHLDEPSRYLLDELLARYHPQNWYFGHFHKYMMGKTDDCHWEGLASLDSGEKFWTSILLWYDGDDE